MNKFVVSRIDEDDPVYIEELWAYLFQYGEVSQYATHRQGLTPLVFVDGKCWYFRNEWLDPVNLVDTPATGEVLKSETPQPVKSDGGSSSYYDIELPSWLMDRLIQRYDDKDGKSYIKTEELVEVAFNNDFDASNVCKSLVRGWGAFNGLGKAGNDVKYEMNKIKYSCDKIVDRFGRKELIGD